MRSVQYSIPLAIRNCYAPFYVWENDLAQALTITRVRLWAHDVTIA